MSKSDFKKIFNKPLNKKFNKSNSMMSNSIVSTVSNYTISNNALSSNPYVRSTATDISSNLYEASVVSDVLLEKLVEDALKKDDELFPIVERYLINHLEKIMDNPDKIIKDLIKEKDDTIKELSNKVDKLERDVMNLKSMLPIPVYSGYGYPGYFDPLDPTVYSKPYIGDISHKDINRNVSNGYTNTDSTTTTC